MSTLGAAMDLLSAKWRKQLSNSNFLGIERLTKRVETVRRKAEKIENVRVLRADTLFAVRDLLPESSVRNFLPSFSGPVAEAAASVSDASSRAIFWMQSPLRWSKKVSCASRLISSIIFVKLNG